MESFTKTDQNWEWPCARCCPSERFIANFTMVYGRYIDILFLWFINQRSHHWGGTTCSASRWIPVVDRGFGFGFSSDVSGRHVRKMSGIHLYVIYMNGIDEWNYKIIVYKFIDSLSLVVPCLVYVWYIFIIYMSYIYVPMMYQ